MPQDAFEKIPKELRELIEVQNIEPDDFDYSNDSIWLELKKESSRAYKKLKDRQYKLRHNLT